MAKDAIDEALKGVNDAEKAFLDQIEQAHKGLKEKEKEAKARFEQMRRELAAKRKEQLSEEQKKNLAKKVDDEKEGIFSRFGDWMHNLAHNSMNAIRKLLGMSPREDKWKKEQVQQAQTVQQQSPDKDAEIERLKKLVDDLKAKLKQQGKNPETRNGGKVPEAPEPKKAAAETVAQQTQQNQPKTQIQTGQDSDSLKKIIARSDFDRSSPITGERMACLAPCYGYDDLGQKLAVETRKPVSPEDFVRAFIYTSLKYNHHSDLSRIIKNATEAFRLSLDSSSVAAPWVTESGKEVIAFNGFDFLCGRFKQRDDDYWALKDRLGMDVKADDQALKDRLGMNEGQFKDFIETAESMDDILHERFGGLKLDINEYRQMVISAAKEEIAAKGLDKKEFDKILNEARKAPEMAVRKLVTDFYQANPYKQTGGLITEDGGFRTWKEHESIEGMTKRMDKNIEQEQKNKGNVSLRG